MIKIYTGTHYGAPQSQITAGSTVSLLDAVLVNGYGGQTPTSITRVGQTVTVTVPVAHGFLGVETILISGADQAAYNGEFPIVVTGANAFSYQCVGSPDTPATGTITAKVAAAGWTRPFVGTNMAAFRQGVGSNGRYIRVVDTAASSGVVLIKGCEKMTSMDQFFNDFPSQRQSAGGVSMCSGGGSNWVVVATESWFYAFMGWTVTDGSYTRGAMFFGDFEPGKQGDVFNTVLIAANPTAGQQNTSGSFTVFVSGSIPMDISNYAWFCRSYTQRGSGLQGGKMARAASLTGFSAGGVPYPDPITGGLLLSKVDLVESGVIRGTLPSIRAPVHSSIVAGNKSVFYGSGIHADEKFFGVTYGTNNGTTYNCVFVL